MKRKLIPIIVLLGTLCLAGCAKENQERKDMNIFEESSVMQEWKENLPESDIAVESALIRGLSVEKDGQEQFAIAYSPKDYKSSFAWWEISEPYTTQATVNTEELYSLLEQLDGMELDAEEQLPEETGISDSDTYITIALSSGADQSEADSVLRFRIGESDGNGHVYVSSGAGETTGTLPESAVNTLLTLDPYDYILKIPVLPDITTVSDVEVEKAGELYTMSHKGEQYVINSREVDEEQYNEMYQSLLNILITGEIKDEETGDTDQDPLLTLRFFRNTEKASDIEVVYYPYNDSSALISINGETSFLADLEEIENVCNILFN